MTQVMLQPAWVLHSRPYRDTSLLVDILTLEYGKLSVLARGARQTRRRSSLAASLQPFTPLLLSYSGQSSLKTLRDAEAQSAVMRLQGERLYSAMYLNELLVRLLPQDDSCTSVFQCYSSALAELESGVDVEPLLRRFEWALLEALGYAVDLSVDGLSGDSVVASGLYAYQSEYGLVAVQRENATGRVYSGDVLLAIEQGSKHQAVGRTKKYLMRDILAHHLGDRPLHSRRLFRAAKAGRAT